MTELTVVLVVAAVIGARRPRRAGQARATASRAAPRPLALLHLRPRRTEAHRRRLVRVLRVRVRVRRRAVRRRRPGRLARHRPPRPRVPALRTGAGGRAPRPCPRRQAGAVSRAREGEPMSREYRTFLDVEIRDASEYRGDTPGVTLQCIRPGVVDDYGSLWNPKAFDASLGAPAPGPVLGARLDQPARARGQLTKRRGPGPRVTFNFSDFDAVPQARRAHAQVLDGTIRDCSVGFSNTVRRDPTETERDQASGGAGSHRVRHPRRSVASCCGARCRAPRCSRCAPPPAGPSTSTRWSRSPSGSTRAS